MSSERTIRVTVASQKVPARTYQVERPVYSVSGIRVGTERHTRVVYERSLDKAHQKILEDARRLSVALGLRLEVVDASESGILRRTLAAVSGDKPGTARFIMSPANEVPTTSPAIAVAEPACTPA